jgi:hypothetical protein
MPSARNRGILTKLPLFRSVCARTIHVDNRKLCSFLIFVLPTHLASKGSLPTDPFQTYREIVEDL